MTSSIPKTTLNIPMPAGAKQPQAAQPMMTPTRVVDNFLDGSRALALRASIDRHFADAHCHGPNHQIWNYWFVPNMYTYLRTTPERIFGAGEYAAFLGNLERWVDERYPDAIVMPPILSMYVDGCVQGWHNDALNGSFAYVYSLTRDGRRSTGGATMVMRPGDLFEERKNQATAGTALYEEIEPLFNRLVVFDDRAIHAVSRVEGTMDPWDARFVLHGHIRPGPPR